MTQVDSEVPPGELLGVGLVQDLYPLPSSDYGVALHLNREGALPWTLSYFSRCPKQLCIAAINRDELELESFSSAALNARRPVLPNPFIATLTMRTNLR